MNKQLLTLMIFIVAIVLIAWQYLLPEFNAVFTLREELDVWQKKLDETQGLKAKLVNLEKKYAGMADEADKVVEAVPAKQDIPGLLVQLEELSSQNGLILQDVSFSAVEVKKSKGSVEIDASAGTSATTGVPAAGGLKTLAVDLSLNGPYLSFKNFVKSVEGNLRIMDITAISFGGQEGDPGALSNQNFKVSLNTYFRQ